MPKVILSLWHPFGEAFVKEIKGVFLALVVALSLGSAGYGAALAWEQSAPIQHAGEMPEGYARRLAEFHNRAQSAPIPLRCAVGLAVGAGILGLLAFIRLCEDD